MVMGAVILRVVTVAVLMMVVSMTRVKMFLDLAAQLLTTRGCDLDLFAVDVVH